MPSLPIASRLSGRCALYPSPLRRTIHLALTGLAACLALPSAHALEAVWLGGYGDWDDGGSWSTQVVPNNSFWDVVIANPSALNISDVTLSSIRSVGRLSIHSGSLSIVGGSSLTVYGGTITNHGALNLAADSRGFASINLGADTLLTGSGETVMSQVGGRYASAINNNGYTLTIDTGHVLTGKGLLGDGTGGFVNKGLVWGQGTSPLYIEVDSSSDKTFDNTQGVVRIDHGNALNLSGTLHGGRIEGVGSAALQRGSFRDLTLVGSLQIDAGSSIEVSGTITNLGTLSIPGGPGIQSLMVLSGDTVLAGSGQTVMSTYPGGLAGAISTGDATLTIAAGHTLRGSGYLGDSTGRVVNRGLVLAEGSSPLNIASSKDLPFDNTQGLVQVADGGDLRVSGAISGGTIQSLGQGKLGGADYENLRLTGTFRTGDSLRLNDVTIADSLTMDPGHKLYTTGTITVEGTLNLPGSVPNVSSTLVLRGDTTLAGRGQTRLGQNQVGYIQTNGQALTIAAGHTVYGRGGVGDGSGSIVNQGVIAAEGGTLYLTSPLDNSLGTLHVGRSGSLVVSAPMTLADPSMLSFDVAAQANFAATQPGGLQVGSTHGLLRLSGNAVYDGKVLLKFSDYQAQIGDQFTLINTSGSFSGSFDTAWGEGNGLIYGLTVQYGEHDVSFTVNSISAVPEPSNWALLLGGIGALAARRRRPATVNGYDCPMSATRAA
ncbi:PEP-CTERM sorting domain-containing protein [Roseateles sp. BYS180W]|uniref:PEP-CTERM sorting domain-containing protein n=1 Tax=Roseateles rivi TaxID=3299028 RepID=A0ABW7FTT9_9BURK